LSGKYPYIVIEGNIGAGKTSLAVSLAKKLQSTVLLEHFEHNPFLAPFYSDPARYAFKLELSFLEERFRHAEEILTRHENVVSDFLWEKSLVFARVNLAPDELELFERIYRHLEGKLRKPDLVIYLERPVDRLLAQIKNRGRNYEQEIPRKYLISIGENYRKFMSEQHFAPVLELADDGDVESLTTRVTTLIQQDFPMEIRLNPS
jgi:deoxyguanosine kinase